MSDKGDHRCGRPDRWATGPHCTTSSGRRAAREPCGRAAALCPSHRIISARSAASAVLARRDLIGPAPRIVELGDLYIACIRGLTRRGRCGARRFFRSADDVRQAHTIPSYELRAKLLACSPRHERLRAPRRRRALALAYSAASGRVYSFAGQERVAPSLSRQTCDIARNALTTQSQRARSRRTSIRVFAIFARATLQRAPRELHSPRLPCGSIPGRRKPARSYVGGTQPRGSRRTGRTVFDSGPGTAMDLWATALGAPSTSPDRARARYFRRLRRIAGTLLRTSAPKSPAGISSRCLGRP